MNKTQCPACCHAETKELRARYLFRADVRTVNPQGVVEDIAIPVLFCPACGRALPETNIPMPDQNPEDVPDNFELMLYEISSVNYDYDPIQGQTGKIQSISYAANFREAYAAFRMSKDGASLIRYMTDKRTTSSDKTIISQKFNPKTMTWDDSTHPET